MPACALPGARCSVGCAAAAQQCSRAFGARCQCSAATCVWAGLVDVVASVHHQDRRASACKMMGLCRCRHCWLSVQQVGCPRTPSWSVDLLACHASSRSCRMLTPAVRNRQVMRVLQLFALAVLASCPGRSAAPGPDRLQVMVLAANSSTRIQFADSLPRPCVASPSCFEILENLLRDLLYFESVAEGAGTQHRCEFNSPSPP